MGQGSVNVVADTRILVVFARARRLFLLRDLFDRLVVPRAVAAEWRAPGPQADDVLLLERAVDDGWLEIHTAPESPSAHANLGPGEAEALALAAIAPPSIVLLDDALARAAARIHGLRAVGTLGILASARERGRSADDILADLRALLSAGLWVRADLVERFRSEVLE